MYVARNSVACGFCFCLALKCSRHNLYRRAAASLHDTARTCAATGLNPASLPPFSNQVTDLAHLVQTITLTHLADCIVPLLLALFCQSRSGAARQRRVRAGSPGSRSSLSSSASRFCQPRHLSIILQPACSELRHSPCAAHAVPRCSQPVAVGHPQEAPHTRARPLNAGRCAGVPRAHSNAAANGS